MHAADLTCLTEWQCLHEVFDSVFSLSFVHAHLKRICLLSSVLQFSFCTHAQPLLKASYLSHMTYSYAKVSFCTCSCNMNDEIYKHIIHTCLDEVTSEYMAAAKQAIMDYVFKSPVEQQRLGLQALKPMLAHKAAAQQGKARVANRDLPDWWHGSVAAAREEIAWTLQTLSANALELNELWIMQGFASRYCMSTWEMAVCSELLHTGRLPAVEAISTYVCI